MKALLAIAAIATSAHAITIDQKYDSYAEVGMVGIVAISSTTPCQDPEKAKTGWRAAYHYRGNGDPGVPACWNDKYPKLSHEKIALCWPGGNPIVANGMDCIGIMKMHFMRTRGLPQRAF